MLILLYRASYYTRLDRPINVEIARRHTDTDKYMNYPTNHCSTNHKFKFIKTIGGLSSNAMWST